MQCVEHRQANAAKWPYQLTIQRRQLSWRLNSPQSRGHGAALPQLPAAVGNREVWLQTSDKTTFQAGLETGCVSAFVFSPGASHRAALAGWRGLAVFRALLLEESGALVEADTGRQVGEVVSVDGAAAARALEARVQRYRQQGQPLRNPKPPQRQQHPEISDNGPGGRGGSGSDGSGGGGGTVTVAVPEVVEVAAGGQGGGSGGGLDEWSLVLDARDWKVIPAENLVALVAQVDPDHTARSTSGTSPVAPSASSPAFPRLPLRLLAAAGSAEAARLMLEALEGGTGGVLLRTDDPAQVRSLAAYLTCRAAEESSRPDQLLPLTPATVMAVRPLGMGDRACVDLAGLLQPGEGLLVGSFARCLALVHSECEESDYIASRPFRVNAGPVHAYVSTPGGRTHYLCELASGSEVLVADPAGRSRTALVGRVKIERRPLVLVELETPGVSPGSPPVGHSLMLQNAETVKLVGPATAPTAAAAAAAADPASTPPEPSPSQRPPQNGSETRESGSGSGSSWRALSVSALRPGDQVWVVLQAAARHTGIAIQEFIVEK